MTRSAIKPENKAKEQPAEGTHAARLLGITDLGHQPGFIFEGKKVESSWKFEFTYELVNHLMEDERPFVVSEDITSKDWEDKKTGRCSTMIARAKALMGPNYRQGVENLEQMLGQACMVTIRPNKSGYMKVAGQAGVGSVPFGMDVKELANKPYFFDMGIKQPDGEWSGEPDMEMWEKMPEFKQNKMKDALNFEETLLSQRLSDDDTPY